MDSYKLQMYHRYL